MDTWCPPHFSDTEQEGLLKMDKTRDMGILITSWADVVKAFELKEETICMFNFIVENSVIHLVITPIVNGLIC
jgi:hypothetical protein